MATTILDIEWMNRSELRAYCERAISKLSDADTKERLGTYLEGFYSDIASLTELAYDLFDGVYDQ